MAATNGRFAAYLRHGNVYVEDLVSARSDKQAACLPIPPVHGHCVLSFSTLQPRLLAVSDTSQVLVCNATDATVTTTIEGSARVVTALCWSPVTENLLWIGTLDGCVSLWNVQSPASPVARSRVGGVCHAIEICASNPTVIASVHNGKVFVSKHMSGNTLRRVATLTVANKGDVSLSWQPKRSSQLLLAASTGKACLWDVSSILAEAASLHDEHPRHHSESNGGKNGFFGDLHGGVVDALQPLGTVLEGLSSIQWISESSFLCLSKFGSRCTIFVRQDTTPDVIELWSTNLKRRALLTRLTQKDGRASLAALSSDGVEITELPSDIAQKTGLDPTQGDNPLPCAANITFMEHSNNNHDGGKGSVRPVSISMLRSSKDSFAKTSKQLQHRRPSFERKRVRKDSIAEPTAKRHNPPSPKAPTSMTSSLELPKQRDEESSPIPFLSPSVPSRNPSPGEFVALDDSIKLPPLARASLDSNGSAAAQESDDSDDETFVDGMRDSASFLPGGINVPLPKACAGLFTPTGQLLTFFPPKPKMAPEPGEDSRERGADLKANAKKVAKLFPTFGNLAGEPQRWIDDDSDSGFESTSSMPGDAGPLDIQPGFAFYSSSFPSQQSWKARISPTKHSFTAQSPHKVIVSLHDIAGIKPLLPASRELASRYRILRSQDETGADLCIFNAKASKAVGQHDAARVWRLAALLLDGRIPFDEISGRSSHDDVLAVAQEADQFVLERASTRRSGGDLHPPTSNWGWATNPLGAEWVVRAVFDWAESLADMQLLAVLSAVLAQVQGHESKATSTNVMPSTTLSSPFQHDYFAIADRRRRSSGLASQSVPVLRTDSMATSSEVYEAPVKLNRTSSASSRNWSQPVTPYLESGTSTPPFEMTGIRRHSTRLSTSGSASPERHRSSFSAVARQYAQSISDKFASYGAYGTSPPARRTGSSPSNTNELSTSFPSGSWGKSVSFASTTNTTKASILSTSYEEQHEDEGYDSDKTVEDLSQPQTPGENTECLLTFKNDRLFDDDVSGGTEVTLIPEDVLSKCRCWCLYYAEQLRCWELLAEAAELEKVCGMTSLRGLPENAVHADPPGLAPVTAPNGSKACSICSIKMTGAQFFCPRCSHAAHPDCLEDFIEAMCADESQPFTCPSGCGCPCDGSPFEAAEPAKEERQVKKMVSITDPRRWRSRMEGDSW